jgi:serine/threonine-protein kinase
MLQPDPANRPDTMKAVAAWPLGTASAELAVNKSRGRSSSSARFVPGVSETITRQWRLPIFITFGLLVLISAMAGIYFIYARNPSTPTSLPQVRQGQDAQPVIADKVANFIAQYEGGDCFFLSAMAISDHRAIIEGLGSSMKPFTAFDADFRRKIGFEADIGVRQVTDKQCPALEFLAQLRGQNARAPHLDIDQDSLHNGDILSGVVERYGTRNLELILVSDLGIVQNLSSLLKQGIDAKTFSIGMRRSDGVTGPQPQLLIAVASEAPIDALRQVQMPDAGQYFAQALIEAAHTGNQLSATARYFVLDR